MSKKFYWSLGEISNWPKITHFPPSALTYDDVLLIPQLSDLKSRSQVDISTKFGPYQLKIPLISAPMDTITGETMARALAKLGAIACLPRDNFAESLRICRTFTKEKIPCVYAIGLKDATRKAQQLEKAGAKIILLDIAHGGMKQVIATAAEIKAKSKLLIMTGNIANYPQALAYKKAGIDFARVGVGPGGLCTTRMVTGSGFPQLSAIFETTSAKMTVIADGGIKKSGDVCKALAAGATLVMIGSLFAGTDETPGEVFDGKKLARGQASESYMNDNGLSVSQHRAAEGISTQVLVKGSVVRLVNEIAGGLKSALTYSGAKNIKQFQRKAIFTLVSQATTVENQAHIKFS